MNRGKNGNKKEVKVKKLLTNDNFRNNQRRKQMKVITVYNEEEEVGKTTVSIGVASCLVKYFRKKVLLVDLGTENGATNAMLGDIDYKSRGNIFDCIYKNRPVKNTIIQQVIPINTKEENVFEYEPIDLFILPGDSESSIERCDSSTLENLLAQVQNEFDYVLIDCPSYMCESLETVMFATNYIIMPIQKYPYGLYIFEILFSKLDEYLQNKRYNKSVTILGIVQTQKQSAEGCCKEMDQINENRYKEILFNTQIETSEVISKSNASHCPPCYYDAEDPVVKEYIALTKEILDRIKKVEKFKINL